MKTKQNILRAALVAAVMTSTYSNMTTAATVNGASSATLITPLVLAQTTPMNFGTVAGSNAVGTVVLDTTNGRTVTGGATLVTAAGTASGAFTITGQAAQAYTMSVTQNAIVTDAGGLNPMNVDTFVLSGSPALTGGADAFTVGATLNLLANQPAGAYSTANGGTAQPFIITANYN